MKKPALLLIMLFCTASICFSAGNIASENQVIMESDWIPTEAQTEAALIHTLNFLTNIKANTENQYLIDSAEEILNEITEYRVQFKGILKQGRTIIYCNFFHISDRDLDWQEVFVTGLDGGYLYWQIEYDLESEQCINFSVNGGA
ncbi:MAG: hypothetical protein V1747_01255 [Candidatus Omnitrophota bacterium]